MPRDAVAAQFLAGPEPAQDEVNALYGRFLTRPADSGALANFVPQVEKGGQDQVLATLLASDEYYAKV